jgi:hypothetical protein
MHPSIQIVTHWMMSLLHYKHETLHRRYPVGKSQIVIVRSLQISRFHTFMQLFKAQC